VRIQSFKGQATDLIKQGATFAEAPKDLFQKVPIVFSMVANDDALKMSSSKNGLLEGAKLGHPCVNEYRLP